ncbi:DedA family protein [Robertmurraya korlensis]|uniref:DedA family protein n=1 Tax=Robertmurraya korlensis TaxID=519977 RepID=UPI000825DE1E|nr:DedA family protein [Robertmurraya korlensis]
MTEILLALIDEWGIGGIYLSLFIEGSAFPFIGTFFIVTVGFIRDMSWVEMILVSIIGSFLYALGSYIPYAIGYRLGHSIENRLSLRHREKLAKVKRNLNKHGIWSIAILSPLHLGNVIPFIAGMSNMKLFPYTILTMLGIAPSTFLFLSIGHFYEGDIDAILKIITEYQTILLVGFVVVTFMYIGWKVVKRRGQKDKVEMMQ